jgi:hypothetical protein
MTIRLPGREAAIFHACGAGGAVPYISGLGSGVSPLLCCSAKHADWFLK